MIAEEEKKMAVETQEAKPQNQAYMSKTDRKGKDWKKAVPTCHYCEKRGHIKDKCWILHPKLQKDWAKDKKTKRKTTKEDSKTRGCILKWRKKRLSPLPS